MKIESILNIVAAKAKADLSSSRNTALYDLQAGDGFTTYTPRRLAYGTDGTEPGVKFVAHLDELDALAQRLNLLLPANPGSMAVTTLGIQNPSTYQAKRALDTSGILRTTVRKDSSATITIRLNNIPLNEVLGYGLVTAGNTLFGRVVDTDTTTIQAGTLTVTAEDETNALPITREQNGVSFTINEAASSTPGFVRAITATSYLASLASLTPSNLQHALAQISYTDATYGVITKDIQFDVDDVVSTQLDPPSLSFTGSGTLNRFVSGVPSLSANDTINVSISLNGAYSTHYAPTVLRVTPNTAWTTGAVQNFPGVVTVAPGGSDSKAVSITTAENKKATTAGPIADTIAPFSASTSMSVQATGFVSDPSLPSRTSTGNVSAIRRLDTVRLTRTNGVVTTLLESEFRVKSKGDTLFPALGTFGGIWDPTRSLKDGISINGGVADDDYKNELQVVYGRVVYPRGNYIPFGTIISAQSNLDYDSDITAGAAGARWITFNCGGIEDASSIKVRILGALGNWSTGVPPEQTTGLFLQYRVVGAPSQIDGWINGNKSYSNVGAPAINNTNFSSLLTEDQGGVESPLNQATTRVLTLTNNTGLVTGTLYIRIGLLPNSGLSFTGISIA